MTDTRLIVDQLHKSFGEVIAIENIDLTLKTGEIHALCGENGAGKSTLIKCLSGIWPHGSYEGSISFENQLCQFKHLEDAEQVGISVIYQELALVPEMSIAENVFLGQEPTKGPLIDWHKMQEQCQRLIQQYGLELDPKTKVKHLGIGQQQMVEILKALSKKSKLLLLDEPTAALTQVEVKKLLEIVWQLKDKGITCLYISHRLDEVFEIADTITVIRDGRSIISAPKHELTQNEVIQHMVGRKINDLFPKQKADIQDIILEVQNLNIELPERDSMQLRDINFTLHRGEVLGIGGLMGAGRSELLLHLFCGWGNIQSGQVHLMQRPYQPKSAYQSIHDGMAMVSEDRKGLGLILEQSIGFNLSLSHLKHFVHKGLIKAHLESKANQSFFERLKVKAPHLGSAVSGLSGGNQQKVVLGKALMTEPEVIFLDEPTRGIDVGAKIEVYQLINQLTQAGKAVIMVSSELPELLGMSDRILMLCEGRQTGIFDRQNATQEKLMTAAMETQQPLTI